MSAGQTATRPVTPAAPGAESRGGPSLPPALEAELRAGGWEYPWPIAPGVTAPVGDPGARHAAWTLERMIEEPARDALALSGRSASAIAIGCGEGRLAHRLLEWHAARVLGLETRPSKLRRADLLRNHYAVPEGSLELRGVDDLDQLEPDALGEFDVVLLVGMFDRVEERGGLIRLARACARRLCVIESGPLHRRELVESLRRGGFETVRHVQPPSGAERRYALSERAVLLAAKGAAP